MANQLTAALDSFAFDVAQCGSSKINSTEYFFQAQTHIRCER